LLAIFFNPLVVQTFGVRREIKTIHLAILVLCFKSATADHETLILGLSKCGAYNKEIGLYSATVVAANNKRIPKLDKPGPFIDWKKCPKDDDAEEEESKKESKKVFDVSLVIHCVGKVERVIFLCDCIVDEVEREKFKKENIVTYLEMSAIYRDEKLQAKAKFGTVTPNGKAEALHEWNYETAADWCGLEKADLEIPPPYDPEKLDPALRRASSSSSMGSSSSQETPESTLSRSKSQEAPKSSKKSALTFQFRSRRNMQDVLSPSTQ
jgi:hypothetical protein